MANVTFERNRSLHRYVSSTSKNHSLRLNTPYPLLRKVQIQTDTNRYGQRDELTYTTYIGPKRGMNYKLVIRSINQVLPFGHDEVVFHVLKRHNQSIPWSLPEGGSIG